MKFRRVHLVRAADGVRLSGDAESVFLAEVASVAKEFMSTSVRRDADEEITQEIDQDLLAHLRAATAISLT